MKNRILFGAMILLTISCTIAPQPSKSFDEKVATQAAIVMTATALDKLVNSPTETSQPVTESPSQTSAAQTSTPETEDPINSLGTATWKDDLNNAGNWFSTGSFTSDNTKFSPTNNGITAVTNSLSDGLRWYLYYEKKPKNIFLEGKLDSKQCSGKDQFGLVFRAPNLNDGFAYFFGITCDGGYILRKWDNSGLSVLAENSKSEAINSGVNQSNRLGVWAKEDSIRLYANGKFLQEIKNDSLINDGHFGLFMNARETPGLSVTLDEISYWVID
jgi:hypothetical protein